MSRPLIPMGRQPMYNCTIQDDLDHRSNQIKNMHKVYENALLTLVIVSGDRADAGIPGIDGRLPRIQQARWLYRRWSQHEYVLFAGMLNIKDIIKESAWAKRGWTY